MRVVVIVPPVPIATPQDVPGPHAGDDAMMAGLIAAAQARIDGPTGNINRALGLQTIEIATPCLPRSIPYRPVLDLVSVEVDGVTVDGVSVDREGHLSYSGLMPHGAAVIRYRAGYDGSVNGPVPANAKAAIVLMVQDMLAAQAPNGGLRSFDVDGAFSEAYNSPDQVQRSRGATIEGLLAPLRVFA